MNDQLIEQTELEDNHYQCNICYVVFSTDLRWFNVHMAIHKKDYLQAVRVQSQYTCHICNESFFEKRYLLKHWRKHAIVEENEHSDHTVKKDSHPTEEYHCDKCDKVFKTHSHFTRHMARH